MLKPQVQIWLQISFHAVVAVLETHLIKDLAATMIILGFDAFSWILDALQIFDLLVLRWQH